MSFEARLTNAAEECLFGLGIIGRDATIHVSGLGAGRCAQELSARLGVPVSKAAVEELAVRGLLGYAGTFKGCQLYDVEGLAAVAVADAVAAEEAVSAARLMTRVQAARYLRVRQADFDLLVRTALIMPDDRKRGYWQGWVRLFSRATLDAFAARPDIDWEAVRSTPRGRRSPLYELAEGELVMLALGGPTADERYAAARRR
jgi:hypothetical protein